MKLTGTLLLFTLLLSCRQSPSIPDDFDYGKTENGVYRNTFFGIELTAPAGWAIQTRDQLQNMLDSVNRMIAESDKKLAEKIKTIPSTILFAAFQYKTDPVTGEYNSSIALLVEDIRHDSGVKYGADYLEAMMRKIS